MLWSSKCLLFEWISSATGTIFRIGIFRIAYCVLRIAYCVLLLPFYLSFREKRGISSLVCRPEIPRFSRNDKMLILTELLLLPRTYPWAKRIKGIRPKSAAFWWLNRNDLGLLYLRNSASLWVRELARRDCLFTIRNTQYPIRNMPIRNTQYGICQYAIRNTGPTYSTERRVLDSVKDYMSKNPKAGQ